MDKGEIHSLWEAGWKPARPPPLYPGTNAALPLDQEIREGAVSRLIREPGDLSSGTSSLRGARLQGSLTRSFSKCVRSLPH